MQSEIQMKRIEVNGVVYFYPVHLYINILGIKLMSSRNRPYQSGYGNTKSFAITSFLKIIPEKYTF